MYEAMNGKTYLRALLYALKAVPTGDDQAHLQHVTMHGNRITGADQTRRHDGYLAGEVPTMSVTRESAVELVMALEYALKVSKRRSGTFSVKHDGGLELSIDYGGRLPLIHKLEMVDVGGHPKDAAEWVPADAPLNPAGVGHVDCGAFRDAVSWWRAWDKDLGTCEARGGQDGGPVRLDVTAGGQRVATAFVLPMDHPPAELRDTLPLFDGPDLKGRSNLALDLSGDGSQDLEPVKIKVGEVELNVTGLGNPEALLVTGPCDHRDTHDACLPCTEDKVASARRAKALAEAGESPGGRRRGKRKPVQTDLPTAG